MPSAMMVSAMKTQRECSPTFRPKAAPGLYTSVSRSQSPEMPRDSGRSAVSAHHFVSTSAAVTAVTTAQNAAALFLRIFLALLAVDAIAGMRERVETLVRDVVAALMTLAEGLRRAIEAAQGFIDVPQEAAFLARHEKHFLALHGVGTLIGHV